LKPLKGVDKALEANLESFFRISYPKFEILFSVDSKSDPAAQVVKRLIDRHPTVDAKLIYCEQTCSFSLFVSDKICLNNSYYNNNKLRRAGPEIPRSTTC